MLSSPMHEAPMKQRIWRQFDQVFDERKAICCYAFNCPTLYFGCLCCEICCAKRSKFKGVVKANQGLVSLEGVLSLGGGKETSVKTAFEVIKSPVVRQEGSASKCCLGCCSINDATTQFIVQSNDGLINLGRMKDMPGALTEIWPKFFPVPALDWIKT